MHIDVVAFFGELSCNKSFERRTNLIDIRRIILADFRNHQPARNRGYKLLRLKFAKRLAQRGAANAQPLTQILFDQAVARLHFADLDGMSQCSSDLASQWRKFLLERNKRDRNDIVHDFFRSRGCPRLCGCYSRARRRTAATIVNV